MYFAHCYQDDEGDNAFHIAADAAKMIRENLEWLIVMLRNPDASVEARNHRQVPIKALLIFVVLPSFARDSLHTNLYTIKCV